MNLKYTCKQSLSCFCIALWFGGCGFSVVLFVFKSKKVAQGLVLMCFCETASESELIPLGGVGQMEKIIGLCEVQDVKPDT